MNHLLSKEHIDVLAQFAFSRVLVAFDFDGTLAPIVAERDDARMRPRTAELLGEVCRLYPCAVISGRSRDDVEARLGRLPLRHVIGNHGLEPGDHMAEFEREVAFVLPQLRAELAGVPGVDIEDKRFSIAIHYRRSRRKREARAAIHAAIASLSTPMRLVAGKLVINVIPERAPHKGDALVRIRRDVGADTAVYVGDDVTDEDVFELDQPGRLLSIRIGRSASSSAPYFLRDQREVDRLLASLVGFRREGASR